MVVAQRLKIRASFAAAVGLFIGPGEAIVGPLLLAVAAGGQRLLADSGCWLTVAAGGQWLLVDSGVGRERRPRGMWNGKGRGLWSKRLGHG